MEGIRLAAGVGGASPFWDRGVVEFAGSLSACEAMDPHHSKPIVRRLAQFEFGLADAWRPKHDALHEWLLRRAVANHYLVQNTLDRIGQSDRLSAWIDRIALNAAIKAAREGPRIDVAMALLDLFAFTEWAESVEEFCRS
jgi:hypothetical protein